MGSVDLDVETNERRVFTTRLMWNQQYCGTFESPAVNVLK
jgi:hypothetical protein